MNGYQKLFLGLVCCVACLAGIWMMATRFGPAAQQAERIATEAKSAQAAADAAAAVRQQQFDQQRTQREQQAANIARAEQQQIESQYGRKPDVSAWDGVATAAWKHLENALHDPGSYQFIDCSEVRPTTGGWGQWVRFRAKNAFGGLIQQKWVFLIRDERVIVASPVE